MSACVLLLKITPVGYPWQQEDSLSASSERYLFTSESVTEGHPDKICDQISDAVLDAVLTEDKASRVACETLVKDQFVCVAGEITTSAKPDFEKLVRHTIRQIGYTD